MIIPLARNNKGVKKVREVICIILTCFMYVMKLVVKANLPFSNHKSNVICNM